MILLTDLQVCGETTAEPYSKDTVTTILQSEDTVCGLYPRVPCLKMGSTAETGCTIDTAADKTYCTYDATANTMILYAAVKYNVPSFDQQAIASPDGNKIQFWSCVSKRCIKLFS